MRVSIVALVVCFTLASCYTPEQAQLSSLINEKVTLGMPMSSAIKALTNEGFACVGNTSTDCSRVRQRLLPSSCIERVRLYSDNNSNLVDRVDVPPIDCAGL